MPVDASCAPLNPWALLILPTEQAYFESMLPQVRQRFTKLIQHWSAKALALAAVDHDPLPYLAPIFGPKKAESLPFYILGDLDSTPQDTTHPQINLPDQHTNDLDKTLAYLYKHHPSLQTAHILSFQDQRQDHELFNLLRLIQSPFPSTFIWGPSDVWMVGHAFNVPSAPGSRISLFSLWGESLVWADSLRWPLQGEALSPKGLLSLSNESTLTYTAIQAQGEALALCVPYELETLDALVESHVSVCLKASLERKKK